MGGESISHEQDVLVGLGWQVKTKYDHDLSPLEQVTNAIEKISCIAVFHCMIIMTRSLYWPMTKFSKYTVFVAGHRLQYPMQNSTHRWIQFGFCFSPDSETANFIQFLRTRKAAVRATAPRDFRHCPSTNGRIFLGHSLTIDLLYPAVQNWKPMNELTCHSDKTPARVPGSSSSAQIVTSAIC